MIFSKALLAKGLGGLAMVGTGSLGIISTKVYLDNKLTRFDQGLIDFLNESEDTSTDIVFSVKKDNTDLTNSFPDFTNGNEQTATVSIKVSVNTTNGTEGTLTEKTGSNKGTKTYLQKLNKAETGDNGTPWTWVCEIKFIREGSTGTELKEKEKLVNSSNGFFSKLKEKKPENKALKKQFIRNCAGERGFKKNWEISKEEKLTDNKIETTKEFKLIKGDALGKNGNDDANKLFPVNEAEFNSWFGINS